MLPTKAVNTKGDNHLTEISSEKNAEAYFVLKQNCLPFDSTTQISCSNFRTLIKENPPIIRFMDLFASLQIVIIPLRF